MHHWLEYFMAVLRYWHKVAGAPLLRVSIFCVALITTGHAKTPGKPKDWSVTSQSTDSVVMFRVESFNFNYFLHFGEIDGVGQPGSDIRLHVSQNYTEPYVARALQPGTYVLKSVYQQGIFGTCFWRETKSIRVEPGKIYLLGEFNSAEILSELAAQAFARGKAKITAGSRTMGWAPSIAPHWSPVTADDLRHAKSYVSSHMPKSTAEIEILDTKTAQFQVSNMSQKLGYCG